MLGTHTFSSDFDSEKKNITKFAGEKQRNNETP